jgi:hypothetical protein
MRYIRNYNKTATPIRWIDKNDFCGDDRMVARVITGMKEANRPWSFAHSCDRLVI